MWQTELAFQKLKCTFTEAPSLQHFNLAKPMIIKMAASGLAIAGILNQYDVFGVPRPVNFYSQKCSPAEQNYATYDCELLPIVETHTLWRHYLKGANYNVFIRCDHNNLEYFQTSRVLPRSLARWLEILSAYNFVIEHPEGSKNAANSQSRLPDYEMCNERPGAQLVPIV